MLINILHSILQKKNEMSYPCLFTNSIFNITDTSFYCSYFVAFIYGFFTILYRYVSSLKGKWRNKWWRPNTIFMVYSFLLLLFLFLRKLKTWRIRDGLFFRIDFFYYRFNFLGSYFNNNWLFSLCTFYRNFTFFNHLLLLFCYFCLFTNRFLLL